MLERNLHCAVIHSKTEPILTIRTVILSEAKDLLSVPSFTQVFPGRVFRFDQRNLLLSQPSLDFFLARNRTSYILEPLEVYKTMHTILAAKARELIVLVLPGTMTDVVGDPDVEDAGFARHDVDAEMGHGAG